MLFSQFYQNWKGNHQTQQSATLNNVFLSFASNSGDLGYIASGEEVRSKETVILSSVGD